MDYEHKALGFQGDAWSCSFHSLHIMMEVAGHRAPLVDLSFTQCQLALCRTS